MYINKIGKKSKTLGELFPVSKEQQLDVKDTSEFQTFQLLHSLPGKSLFFRVSLLHLLRPFRNFFFSVGFFPFCFLQRQMSMSKLQLRTLLQNQPHMQQHSCLFMTVLQQDGGTLSVNSPGCVE